MIEAALCYTGLFLIYRLGGVETTYSLPLIGEVDLSGLLSVFPEVPASHVSGLAYTMFLAGVVTAQIGNAFACRTETQRGRRLGWLRNRFLVAGIAAEVVITLALIYIPPLAKAFDLQPLAASFWLWLLPYAVILYGLDWIRKWIYRWNKNGKDAGAIAGRT
jgi:magnesium-transporting ATPase (P-type)